MKKLNALLLAMLLCLAIGSSSFADAISIYAKGSTAAQVAAIALNTAKDTNVSTSLSMGTIDATNIAITSDGATDDVTLPAATNIAAGVATAAQIVILESSATAAAALTAEALVVGDGGANGVKALALGAAKALVGINDAGTANTYKTVLVSDAGIMTNASQPAFLVRPTATQENLATGGYVTVVFGTEIADRGSNFATNTFTAPVTGLYQLSYSLYLDAVDSAATNYEIRLHTSNRIYTTILDISKLISADASYVHALSILADMDAADTAIVTIYQDGGTAQTDVSVNSFFSGYLAL